MEIGTGGGWTRLSGDLSWQQRSPKPKKAKRLVVVTQQDRLRHGVHLISGLTVQSQG